MLQRLERDAGWKGSPVRAAGVCWEAQVSLQGPQTGCGGMCIMEGEGRAAGLSSLLPGVALLRSWGKEKAGGLPGGESRAPVSQKESPLLGPAWQLTGRHPWRSVRVARPVSLRREGKPRSSFRKFASPPPPYGGMEDICWVGG